MKKRRKLLFVSQIKSVFWKSDLLCAPSNPFGNIYCKERIRDIDEKVRVRSITEDL